LKIANEPTSLETFIGEKEDSHLGYFMKDKKIAPCRDATAKGILHEQTIKVLSDLTPCEENV